MRYACTFETMPALGSLTVLLAGFLGLVCISRAVGETAKSRIPPVPEAVASFGGAVADGWVYVYGGHVGEVHAHTKENLSQHFWRAKLDGTAGWEELPMQTPLQGLALVAHGGNLYRVGGMLARNAPGEEEDMHSVAEFARFSPQDNSWTALPPLPEPRSSHDAVVVGDTLYVIGGWKLAGPGGGEWLDTAWSFDLSKPDTQWQPLPEPPFHRRALAASHWHNKLVVMGGIAKGGETSVAANLLDLETGEWQKGPDLPAEALGGFGMSACHHDGELYIAAFDGILHRLSDDGSSWQSVAKLQDARIFHRLLPAGPAELMIVAGALDAGHDDTVEIVPLPAKNESSDAGETPPAGG